MKSTQLILPALCILVGASAASAQAVKQELQQKLAMVKESVARNQAALKQYTWTEHTDMSLKGEVKKSTDNICRYGSDGKVAKTAIGTPAPKKEMRGMKKKMAEKKVGELTDYMERAAALIHRYMPPAPESMPGGIPGREHLARPGRSRTNPTPVQGLCQAGRRAGHSVSIPHRKRCSRSASTPTLTTPRMTS